MDFNLTEKLYNIKTNGRYPMHMPGHKEALKCKSMQMNFPCHTNLI